MYCIVHCREKQDLCRLFAYQQSEISHFTKNNQIHLLLRAGGLPDLFCNWNGPSAVDHQLRDLPHMGTLHCHLHNYRYGPTLPGTINLEIFPTWARSTATSITTGIWPHPARDHQLRDLPHIGPWTINHSIYFTYRRVGLPVTK